MTCSSSTGSISTRSQRRCVGLAARSILTMNQSFHLSLVLRVSPPTWPSRCGGAGGKPRTVPIPPLLAGAVQVGLFRPSLIPLNLSTRPSCSFFRLTSTVTSTLLCRTALYLAAMRAILYPRLQYNMGFYFKYLVPPTFLPVLPPLRSFALLALSNHAPVS